MSASSLEDPDFYRRIGSTLKSLFWPYVTVTRAHGNDEENGGAMKAAAASSIMIERAHTDSAPADLTLLAVVVLYKLKPSESIAF